MNFKPDYFDFLGWILKGYYGHHFFGLSKQFLRFDCDGLAGDINIDKEKIKFQSITPIGKSKKRRP